MTIGPGLILRNVKPEKEHPDGSVQALCSTAVGLFAVLIAFLGYTGFRSGDPSPWNPEDRIYLVFAGGAEIAFILVPWFATRPRLPLMGRQSLRWARLCFAMGACCAVLSIGIFVYRDYRNNNSEERSPTAGASKPLY